MSVPQGPWDSRDRDRRLHTRAREVAEAGTPSDVQYLPKAPYVLTILRALKELFMTCLGLSKLTTTGMLSQAIRTPSARLTFCRTLRPGPGEGETAGKHPPPCSRPPRPRPLSRRPGLTGAEEGAAGPAPGSLGRGSSPHPLSPQPRTPPEAHVGTDS